MVAEKAIARRDIELGRKSSQPRVLGSLAAGRSSMLSLARMHNISGEEQLVVIKRPHPDAGLDPSSTAAFAREANFAARVEHAHVVAVHVIGADASGPYFVMDFVEGVSLLRLQTIESNGRALLTPLPTAISVRIALDMLDALVAVHRTQGTNVPSPSPNGSAGLVHGDVSPGNLLVSIAGKCLLADFGATTTAGSQIPKSTVGAPPRPGYAAPEIVLGEPAHASADIFSAGVVLWELFSGRRLFSAPTPQMVARQTLGGYIPDLTSIAPTVPRPVALACERALARNPKDRFPSAAQFRDELSDAITRSYGRARHNAVAAFVQGRCADVLTEIRQLFGASERAATSGLRPRVRES
jgi:eukaryotic-like serine/threonine-protein kinase